MNALSTKEVAVIQMALGAIIQDTEEISKDPEIPFTPDARKDMSDILENAKSALSKIVLASGSEVKLDPYVEGDENDFLTKES